MFVANQDTKNIAVFAIDQGAGTLEKIASNDVGFSPTCVIIVDDVHTYPKL